ncbi:hypothetical protein AvCA_49730 [Azotobacter vinelandii CA]|uniref:Uncharacterized protein n=4 Tax=Pseudomonadaceae TaxID=135621 RepID=C1DL71_AZOVD|nr:hypothetical protein Avin_49730 [Azotobacter vinelandii DJ]AGK15807.1 hypothetical protein AvCA_49730 [Azotobacter vinelandii CA]AGK22337.1 hypothetical protein AvCA6_49730 [Azotobacter vinelandii CA6]
MLLVLMGYLGGAIGAAWAATFVAH